MSPWRDFLAISDQEIAVEVVDRIFDHKLVEGVPGVPVFTPQMIAYFEYLVWQVTRGRDMNETDVAQ
jgi:hypothetical protein